MRVFMEMKRSTVRPDVVAYTSLLAALQGTPQVRRQLLVHGVHLLHCAQSTSAAMQATGANI